jgi:Spy/CpxP family protein refolding chaperone
VTEKFGGSGHFFAAGLLAGIAPSRKAADTGWDFFCNHDASAGFHGRMKYTRFSPFAGGMIAMVLSLAPLHAQSQSSGQPDGKQPAPPKIEDRLSRMKQTLSLSDDQVAKLKTIFEEQKAKIDPIWKDASLSKEQKKEKAKPIADETRTKIDAVLTPEQKTKLEQVRKEKREKSQQ